MDSIGRLIQQQMIFKQMDPNSQMILDPEAVMRLTGKDLNAPAVSLKTPDALQAERDQAAKMQQQQHDAQVAEQTGGAVKDVAGGVKNLAEAHAAGNA